MIFTHVQCCTCFFWLCLCYDAVPLCCACVNSQPSQSFFGLHPHHHLDREIAVTLKEREVDEGPELGVDLDQDGESLAEARASPWKRLAIVLMVPYLPTSFKSPSHTPQLALEATGIRVLGEVVASWHARRKRADPHDSVQLANA
ncbi:unnamed protein product [Periconia digitata]|uniref:Secreted protein n=1 Tax=Periconia digitata TaxID=1303443 RepID=A0A9W4UA01_9PLEO|nr:unnamed protein product [Periconia digitata]